MNKVIVTTTIHAPGQALELYDAIPGWTLVVAGDRRTPRGFGLKNGIYLSPSDQEKLSPRLSELVGWNVIQRRNFGFLMARKLDADLIATVDDDNIPYGSFGHDILAGRTVKAWEYDVAAEAFDPVGATNYPHLWHRGFPLQLLSGRDYSRKKLKRIRPDIQANFWNGDPDVDALCRMQYAPRCDFSPTVFPFSSNKPGPFDSQNTIITRRVLPHYFMFGHVGRMDDIWASYYVQSLGFQVVYGPPTVFQDRHPHDLTKDFTDEVAGYEKNLELVRDLARDPWSLRQYLPDRTILAFREYQKHFPECPAEIRF